MALTLTTRDGGGTTVPCNVECEIALLGAILLDNRTFEAVGGFLLADHFHLDQHQVIYQTIADMIEAGRVADPVTIRNLFREDGSLQDLGGPEYLAEIVGAAGIKSNLQHYGRLLVDLYQKRRISEAASDAMRDAFREVPADTIKEHLEATLTELDGLGPAGGARPLSEFLGTAMDLADVAHKAQGITGLGTGIGCLDAILGGLHPTDLVVLAGRPGMGKTALATNIMMNVVTRLAEAPVPAGVLGFSLEMSGDQLALREVAARAGISSHRVRTGRIGRGDLTTLHMYADRMKGLPLFIDDRANLSIQAMRASARRVSRVTALALIVVDYLQLMSANVGRGEGRVQEISAITRGLKALAKEMRVPVLALSQLSRGLEQRDDKRPQLSDLRESGSIEQDADAVVFLFREEYYLQAAEPMKRQSESDTVFAERRARWQSRMDECRNVCQAIVAKQRHGPTGVARLHFNPDTTTFTDLDDIHNIRA